MTKGSVIIAFFVTLITHFSFQLFWGDCGINAYSELQNYQVKLVEHLDEQERLNLLMNDRLSRLQHSGETLRREAASLNYIMDQDNIIFIRGWEERQMSFEKEEILRFQPAIQKDRSRLFRILSFTTGIIAFLILILWNNGEKEKEKPLTRIL